MHPTTVAAVVFAFNVAPTLSYVYSTQTTCTTRLGSNSVSPVKTSSYVLTIPITFTKKATITPVSTITPPPVTTTSTVTTTTTSTVLTTPTTTVTETDTETDTATISSTVVVTETDTATTTTTPAAVTIPTVAGFTPLASEGSYSPKKRSESHAEAAVPAIRGRTVAQTSLNKCPPVGNPGKFSPAQYPTSVICGALVEQITTSTKTYTASTTVKTTIAPVTSTVTTTSTNTMTITSTPTTVSVTSTTTITTTTSTTITNTQRSTTTTTSTVVAPTPTSYAACASNNVIGSANGGFGIDYVYYSTIVQLSQVAITDPVACCDQCQTTASCVGFAQYPGGPCFIFTYPSSQCDGSQSYYDYFQTIKGLPADQGYYVGNGNCGQFTDGGSAD